MFQRSPLPIRQQELPITQNVLSTESYQIPRVCVNDPPDLSSIQPYQSVEVNYQTKSKFNIYNKKKL